MNKETIFLPEFKKLPNDFFTVIADDRIEQAHSTQTAIMEAFAAGEISHGGVHIVQSATELMTVSLSGKSGDQADVVLLDDEYNKNYQDWRQEYDFLVQLASQASVDFSHFKIPDRGGYTVIGKMPDDLYHPSSTNFAIVLRILGFKNNIFVVSSAPPDPEEIVGEQARLAEFTPFYKPIFPVNGVSTKKPDFFNEIRYSREIKKGYWNNQKIKSTLTQSLRMLLTS